MNKVKTLLLALLVVAAISCNNSGSETSTGKDSAATADTIKSDPSKFSDPH